jgi:hypothetical protein
MLQRGAISILLLHGHSAPYGLMFRLDWHSRLESANNLEGGI